MEIGLGIDTRYALSEDDQRTIAREAASLGYASLWTPIGSTREPFDICALWHESSRLATGIAVAPLSGWSIADLAPIAKDTYRRCTGRFTLGIGSGRLTAARTAFAKMVVSYALARPGADKTKGYRGHFARMGFGSVLDDLEARRAAGATEDELAARFPDKFLRRVGYWGRPQKARQAFQRFAARLDIAIVRLVPAPPD